MRDFVSFHKLEEKKTIFTNVMSFRMRSIPGLPNFYIRTRINSIAIDLRELAKPFLSNAAQKQYKVRLPKVIYIISVKKL